MEVIRQKYDHCKRSIPTASWTIWLFQFDGILMDSGWMASLTIRPMQQLQALH
jgi:hypothetical protein